MSVLDIVVSITYWCFTFRFVVEEVTLKKKQRDKSDVGSASSEKSSE